MGANFQITLNGAATVTRVVRRTAPIALPVVNAPPPPAGARSVTITSTGQSVGDFSTVRDLTLTGGMGHEHFGALTIAMHAFRVLAHDHFYRGPAGERGTVDRIP